MDAVLKACKDGLADRSAALHECMIALEIVGADEPGICGHCRAQQAHIDQIGDLVEKSMLQDHIRRLINRAGEHQFPVDRDTLALQPDDVEHVRIVDQSKLALRRKPRLYPRKVFVGCGETGDLLNVRNFQFAQLLG